MNYGFELMSEIIPLCIVAVLGIDMKKGGEKDFLPSIIILSIIEIPALIVTLFCMFIKIPQSNSRHIMATAFCFRCAYICSLSKKKIEILFI